MFSSQREHHDGQPINEYTGWALAHKGPAKAPSTTYSSSDGPEKYTSPRVHEKLTKYADAARAAHGDNYDVTREPIDPKLVMRLGGGKQHRRFYMAHSAIDPSSVPTLTQIRKEDQRRGGAPRVPIAPREQSSAQQIAGLQVSGVSFVVRPFHK